RYGVALDDLRGIIRELPNPAVGWLWVKFGWWILVINCILWAAICGEGIKKLNEW
ncbi:unnamed protein product, partial [marine sediment metagenome]